jgi:hypothetical protein
MIHLRHAQWHGVRNLQNKEGRKLNLCERNLYNMYTRWKPVKATRMVSYDFVAPHEKRRDDVRLSMRTRMAEHPDVALYS